MSVELAWEHWEKELRPRVKTERQQRYSTPRDGLDLDPAGLREGPDANVERAGGGSGMYRA